MLLNKEEKFAQDSYYEASATRPAPQAPLAGRASADVAVVGAGLAGISAALELALRGYSVALLEAREVGWGASGRNGGQAIVGYASEDAIEAQFAPADVRRAWEISVEGMELLRARIKDHAIDCEYQPGYMFLAVNARKGRELAAWAGRVQENYGYALQTIAPPDVGGWIASERFHSGIYDPLSGHLHPLKYSLGLAAAARAAGVKIYENTPVLALEQGAKPVLRTAQGELECSFVVLAGNVYLNEFAPGLAPKLARRIMPVGTYITITEPLGKERAQELIPSRAAVCDNNFVLDYFRTTADERLLFGGRVSYSAATPLNLQATMGQRMAAVFPQLAGVPLSHTWGGFVDISRNRAPDFGRLANNIYYLQGFSGHGLALTGIAGKLAAEAIAGQAERFDLLARLRHRAFPGGALMRTPALVLGMLYYRLKDLL